MFLRDEEHERQALADAIETVTRASGYSDVGTDKDGTIHMGADNASRIRWEAQLCAYDL